MNLEYDLDQPVELTLRGDFIDVIGWISTALEATLDGTEDYEWETYTREEKAASDAFDQLQSQVNLGAMTRELKRHVQGGTPIGYRGINLAVHDFDPKHPRPHGEAQIEKLTPLEETEAYVIALMTEDSIEYGTYPDHADDTTILQLSSALRICSREMEQRFTEAPPVMEDEIDGE